MRYLPKIVPILSIRGPPVAVRGCVEALLLSPQTRPVGRPWLQAAIVAAAAA
jgi:hypothetical protein